MIAIPIVPGCMYRVRCAFFDTRIEARHPCDALSIAYRHVLRCQPC